jgi:hypothetical protein
MKITMGRIAHTHLKLTSKMDRLTEDQWLEKFKPIDNHLIDDEGTYMGKMFETYGEELEFVLKILGDSPDKVWTITEDEGHWYLGAGYHYVNRIGYLITEVSHDGSMDNYAINLTEDLEFDEDGNIIS